MSGWGYEYYYEDPGHDGFGYKNKPLDILHNLDIGTVVRVWFDSSLFITAVFQFIVDDVVAFSSIDGGRLDSVLTYIKATEIRAIDVGLTGFPPETTAPTPII